ncbi:ATP synthase F0 subunit 8 (mitochondrion) [Halyomorpha halys]|uniref:ATP synthase FO subunit 8 n=1 Tax=Halyomorpha halys TaxID=286706 RepID=C8YQC1_HALHY|nr:ATP synthase F0 subunit 8 [Halyomorpha halys]ACM79576.1 ATP synthase FO subunit 8 [Halyomorpha halys]
MPQMSPLWWEILFIYFIMSYFMFNIFIYFSINKPLSFKMNKNKKIEQMNWSW